MKRVLKPVVGRGLVYAWAREQAKDDKKSSYLLQCSSNNDDNDENTNKSQSVAKAADTDFPLVLPVHKNRTNFAHADLLVPWNKKQAGTFHRFYHVFEEGELETLVKGVPGLEIEQTWYDQGNWCVVFWRIE